MYDIIVIGGGPAGMTAALYALRNGKTALVIEKSGFGGQATFSPKIENYPGFAVMSGNEFADKLLDQIMAQGADVDLNEVKSVENRGSVKIVNCEDGTRYESKAVILATGVKHRMLGLKDEELFIGNGISFCAVCDGDFYKNKEVCVAGGGNSALQEAILLAGKCSKVTILQDMPFLTGERKLQEILEAKSNVDIRTGVKISEILSDSAEFKGLKTIKTSDSSEESIYCDGLFVAIGLVPENGDFSNIAVLDENGYFASEEDCTTKTPGVFVAGDARRKTLRQITTATSDGAMSAINACRYIDSL